MPFVAAGAQVGSSFLVALADPAFHRSERGLFGGVHDFAGCPTGRVSAAMASSLVKELEGPLLFP